MYHVSSYRVLLSIILLLFLVSTIDAVMVYLRYLKETLCNPKCCSRRGYLSRRAHKQLESQFSHSDSSSDLSLAYSQKHLTFNPMVDYNEGCLWFILPSLLDKKTSICGFKSLAISDDANTILLGACDARATYLFLVCRQIQKWTLLRKLIKSEKKGTKQKKPLMFSELKFARRDSSMYFTRVSGAIEACYRKDLSNLKDIFGVKKVEAKKFDNRWVKCTEGPRKQEILQMLVSPNGRLQGMLYQTGDLRDIYLAKTCRAGARSTFPVISENPIDWWLAETCVGRVAALNDRYLATFVFGKLLLIDLSHELQNQESSGTRYPVDDYKTYLTLPEILVNEALLMTFSNEGTCYLAIIAYLHESEDMDITKVDRYLIVLNLETYEMIRCEELAKKDGPVLAMSFHSLLDAVTLVFSQKLQTYYLEDGETRLVETKLKNPVRTAAFSNSGSALTLLSNYEDGQVLVQVKVARLAHETPYT